jgi:hypothetical protein
MIPTLRRGCTEEVSPSNERPGDDPFAVARQFVDNRNALKSWERDVAKKRM